MNVMDMNLLDEKLFLTNTEHELFSRARRDAPVAFHPAPDDSAGFWAVMRYDDVNTVMMDPELFISSAGTQIKDRKAEGDSAPTIHHLDPPEHQPMRSRAMQGLRRSTLVRLTAAVEEIVKELVDACPDNEPFDFVEKIAMPLPMMVLGRLLGIPREDQPQTVDWANTISSHTATLEEQATSRAELVTYYRGLVADKIKNPDDSLSTELALSEVNGVRLTPEQLDGYFILITAAGNETTRFLVSGGIEQLCLNPVQADHLRQNPDAMPAAIEEMVRWVTPARLMRRTASRDTELGGQQIKKGDKVVVFLASANRDEAYFENPQTFDVTRKKNPHMGFGKGAHFCLGANAARLESVTLFNYILAKKSKIELGGDGEKMGTFMFSGHTALPIRWS